MKDKSLTPSHFLYYLIIWVSCIMLCVPDASGQDKPLNLKYLGCAGWELSNDKVTLLIDPYISRLKLGAGPSVSEEDERKSFRPSDYFESDTALIDKTIGKVDFILVHHSHFDHLSDVPYIAKKTGAKVIATETSCNILRAYGIQEGQLITVKGGEDYQFDDFSVRILPTLHSPLNGKHYFDSRVYLRESKLKIPLRINEFVEGGSLMFLVRMDKHQLLTMGSMNFIEREVQGLNPDVILVGANLSRLEIYKYTERLLALTNFPKTVIPTHWDNYRVPYGFSQQSSIESKLNLFKAEVSKASPNSKFIIPVHLEEITIK
ncbi:MAG TPA: MBL fold metallo-hydrolase [Cyclobacteriaceae bacterium]